MSDNNFMVENCASLPMEALLNIASYMIGNEGWQRLKQCKALGSYKGNGNRLFLNEKEKVDIMC